MTAACRRIVSVLCMTLLLGVVLPAGLGAQVTEPAEEFIPIDELPPEERMAAAPLLIAAYSFVVVALFVYVLSVSRRLMIVQREIERLEGDVKRAGRA